jgi:hypothetical protein
MEYHPIPVAARSKTSVYGRSLAGITGSNPAEGMNVVSVVCCRVEVSATGWSPIQRSLTEYGVPECDREATIIRRLWPTRAVGPWKKKYIYPICSIFLLEKRDM